MHPVPVIDVTCKLIFFCKSNKIKVFLEHTDVIAFLGEDKIILKYRHVLLYTCLKYIAFSKEDSFDITMSSGVFVQLGLCHVVFFLKF